MTFNRTLLADAIEIAICTDRFPEAALAMKSLSVQFDASRIAFLLARRSLPRGVVGAAAEREEEGRSDDGVNTHTCSHTTRSSVAGILV
jgi:hypothetical protein